MRRCLLHKFVLLFFLAFCAFGTAQSTITSQVSTGNDDAEEEVSNGNMDLGSSDLELTSDGGTNQLVGIRFQNITIPQGTTILSASIQFTTDETDSGSTSVTIRGEDVNNASTFSSSDDNISNRTLTSASVAWNSIPAWNTGGESGTNQQTTDLTTIVQEIVNRGGWSSGNSMAFVISGSGERTADSQNGSSTEAPVLSITINSTNDPLPGIISNPNRGLPYIYFIADNRAELYSVAPDPTASPLPAPTTINTTFGGSPIIFDGEGGGYRSTDRLVYVFMGADPTTNSDLYSIDPTTGIATLVKANIVPGHVDGAEFYINNSTGEEVMVLVYQNGTSGGADRITALNPNANGANPAWSTYSGYPIALSGARTRADGISWNPDTADFYIQNDDNVDYYTVNITTGVTAPAFTTSLGIDGEGITYASDGTNYIEDENTVGQGRTIFIVDTSTGGLIPAAQLGSTGDVESIMGNLGTRNDAGDAPSTYGYAAHLLPVLTTTPLSIYLGAVYPDSEDPFVNFSTGFSDDNTGDDEDGVTSVGTDLDGQLLTLGQTKTIDISTNGSGVLNAWLDFNRDGDFDDSGEQIATDVSPSGGNITLNVAIPLTATGGTSYARFRYSSETGLASGNSEASDGEVEDYQVIIYDPTICPPGSTLVETTSYTNVYATSVIVDDSVNNQGNALGSDDSTNARFNDEDDELVLEMDETINNGDSVTINGENGDDFDIWVSSSATGPWTQVGNNAQLDYTFTSPIDWLYIRFKSSNDSSDDNLSYVDATKSNITSSCEPDIDGDAVPDQSDLDNDNDGIPDADEAAGNQPYGDEDGDGILNGVDTTDNGNGGDGSTTVYADGNSDGVPDIYDTDLDGIPNHLDLDSDNDGIFDAVEAGHGQAHTNGVVNSAYGPNGLANLVETSPESGTINYTIFDTDGTGPDNFLDLDSDGDGLPDNVEAQTTLGYTSPSGNDTDNNGVDDAYDSNGTAIVPTNTDGTDTVDYLDTDSDNEGGDDTSEAVITLSGNDIDNDGLDDARDADTTGYGDPGGTIDDPLAAPVILSDLDNDASIGGDVDFRDAIDDRPDNDNDGVVDANDLDDDNDGIPDIDELSTIIANSQPDCTGETTLDFSAVASLVSGTALQQGAVYRIANVTTGTDALVTISQTSNATVANIDNNGTEAAAFKPQTAFNFPNIGDRGFIEYNIQFVNSGGSTPVIITKFFMNFNDIDGGANYGEENWADNPSSYIIDNPTELTMSTYGSWIIATGSLLDHSGSGNGDPEVNFGVNYNSKSEVTIRVGAIARVAGASASGRQHNIEFSCITNYISPDTYGVDTDSDGVANHLDLDADNDGIYDAVEAGHNQAHTNGIVNGSYGANGLADIVETSAESGTINFTIVNTDGTPPSNFLDSDSDDDGCSDANEAYADANADGGDNEYYSTGNPPATDSEGRVSSAAYTIPADSDTSGTQDYIEAVSAPSISTQPIDRAACPGGDTSFSVAAANTNTYQWQQFNGTIWVDLTDTGIHAGTSTTIMTITNAQLTDHGNQYRVIISNTSYVCSSETSDTVNLTVAEPTANAGLDQTICDGDSVTLTASGTGGTPGYTYSWSTGQTTAGITFSPVGDPNSNTFIDYTVTVTDQNGCLDTDTVRVNIESAPTATVTKVDPSCNLNNGSITFTFPDHPNRTGVEFSLDNQATYETNVADNSGSVTYSGLAVASYNVWARWGNNECPVDLGTVTLADANGVPPVPTSGGNQVECADNPVQTLTATATPPADSSVVWFDAATAGNIVASPTLSAVGTISYYAESQHDITGCSSDTRTPVSLTINANPTITVTGSPACNLFLTAYNLEVTVSSGTVTSTAGAVTNSSGNIWDITNVPAGTDIVVTVTDGNSCFTDLPVTAPNCSCPVVNVPISGGNQSFCTGDPVSTINATVNLGETVDWYDASSGGTLLLADNTSYTPSGPGTYYAEAKNTTTGCTSGARTAVSVTEDTPTTATIGPDQTAYDCQNAIFSVSATNVDTYQWQVSTNGGASFSTINDGTSYSGTQTNTMTVTPATIPQNGYRFRVLVSNSTTVCPVITTNSALLTVRVRTVITNRRITHRVNKN